MLAETVWQEYLTLLQDPAHILLELTILLVVDGILGALAWPLVKRWVRAHDKKHHGREQ